jgi:hypothetical protein
MAHTSCRPTRWDPKNLQRQSGNMVNFFLFAIPQREVVQTLQPIHLHPIKGLLHSVRLRNIWGVLWSPGQRRAIWWVILYNYPPPLPARWSKWGQRGGWSFQGGTSDQDLYICWSWVAGQNKAKVRSEEEFLLDENGGGGREERGWRVGIFSDKKWVKTMYSL